MAFSKEKAHERAERYAARGQHERASREYQSIVDHDPKDVRAWLMLADCLARSGDAAGAVSRYLQVAEFYSAQKALPKALAVYRQVLGLDPSRIDVRLRCAAINLELGKIHDALAAYEQVAQTQLQSGRVIDAITTYRAIADADPAAVSKRLRLAELCSREGRVDEAVEAFRDAGAVLVQTNRLADYVRVAERLLYHRADDRPTIRMLARVYLQLGDARRALMKLNALLQADQGDHEGLELLAETFNAMGKNDKAGSVMLELARRLMNQAQGSPEATRIVRKALQWDPRHSGLLQLSRELGSRHASAHEADHDLEFPGDDDPDAIEVDDADVMELDEDDVVEAADSVEMAVPSGPAYEVGDELPSVEDELLPVADELADESVERSMTDVVMSEVNHGASDPTEGASEDLDKILFEARVYVKYRLFDHALDHVQELLDRQPRHVGALSLRASALTELERYAEAAEAHVDVARLVGHRDTRLAIEHLDAALECDPGWQEAKELWNLFSSGGTLPPPDASSEVSVAAPEPARSVVPSASGAALDVVDLEDDDDIEFVEVGQGDDFSVEVSVLDEEDTAARPAVQDFPVENRFGLGDGDGSGTGEREAVGAGAFDATDPERDEDEDDVVEDGDGDLLGGPADALGGFHEVDFEDFEVDAETFAAVPLDSEAAANEQLGDPLAGRSDAASAVSRDWPDLTDELAEVRFFIDQGLGDDAETTLADLKKRYPGHPELVEFGGEAPQTAPLPPSDPSGRPSPTPASRKPTPDDPAARPLVDLSTEEDEEAEAYLSAIFADEVTNAKPRQLEVKAREADVEAADARTHFDLGTAYREMGLVDEALRQFEAASADRGWSSRALTMAATLRVHMGETERAVTDLNRAIATATTEDERCEASYELAVLYEKLGDKGAAVEQLRSVAEGYRDRDERLGALLG